ncbi:MAG TPA: hypothetical protein VD994_17545, partial [Prosthecobacter sp.]|nr:hypothetical protein [Prosthecobacter sp.]
MENPWRLVTWTGDSPSNVIWELAFHESELEEVLSLPFPPGAVCRDPVMMLTDFARAKPYTWFRKRWQPLKPGDSFMENINQGDRWCYVLAVDEDGALFYSYEMPNERVFLRIDGKPVSPNKIPRKWLDLAGDRLDLGSLQDWNSAQRALIGRYGKRWRQYR